jgi:hypothetical protein
MGCNNAKIMSPYYDKYFGPDYYKKIGDNLGDCGQYAIQPMDSSLQQNLGIPKAFYIPKEPLTSQQQPHLVPQFYGYAAK